MTGGNEDNYNKLLAPFLDDLWLKRLVQLEDVFQTLRQNSKSKTAADLIEFFEFLHLECSGKSFDNDKQWSELMNLMEISRKLNHKSVKVKDILKNKLIIEANKEAIRKLNKSVKLLATIGNSLDELEKLVANCKLELPASSVFNKDNQEDYNQIPKQLSSNSSYLKDRCLSILYVLQMELNEESIQKDSRIAEWQQRLDKQQIIIEKLLNFTESLAKLSSKQEQLKSLIGVSLSKAVDSNGSKENKINSSVLNCKQRFAKIHQFYQKLLDSLKRFSSDKKQTIFPLIKLYDIKRKDILDGELYSHGLSNAISNLEECQRDLDEIMQTLRLEFGRFYFINDIELLRLISLDLDLILSKSSETERLIGKLFNKSINSFILDDKNENILGVKTPIGEVIKFLNEEKIVLRKKINLYSIETIRIFNEILRKLSKTLKRLTRESLVVIESNEKIAWNLPIQLITLTEYIKFVKSVENSLKDGGDNFKKLIDFYEQRFKLLSFEKEDPSPEVAEVQLKRSAMVSLTVHFISILINLRQKNVSNVQDWQWQKQVRYYSLDEEIEVCIANARFNYKFDLLPIETNEQLSKGMKITYKRLINTTITERCFLVSIEANYKLKLGSNPYGPAGSGKTETVKALGQLLGNQVIVHNCDESNDEKSLNRLIWGLAHTGLWGCFDEFNRLNLSVLSGVSGTLELVQSSLRENKTTVEIVNTSQIMRLDPASSFFITLNPTICPEQKTYGGRRRLPANIRNLFVPISMSRVEMSSIIAEKLMSFGGNIIESSEMALELGRKLELCMDRMRKSLQLNDNKQVVTNNRCEWDLRLVMAILRRFKNSANNIENSSHIVKVLAQSLCNEVSSRLTSNEITLFLQELENIFGFQLEIAPASCSDYVIKLKQQLEIRTGVILLGSSNSGKSKTWKSLQESMTDKKVLYSTLNPRSCKRGSLFGSVDTITGKWRDGLLTNIVRNALRKLENNNCQEFWLIFDGPIEPDWIESLNSVLDDNLILTLSSGERIPFSLSSGASIKLIFETNNLKFASPATISRLGLINFEQKEETKNYLKMFKRKVESLEDFSAGRSRLLVLDEPYDVIRSKIPGSIYYNCHKHTDSENLFDLLARFSSSTTATANTFLIEGIDIIEADCWCVREFVELLRYIITYNAYYDPKSFFSLTGLDDKIKFVLIIRDVLKANKLEALFEQRILPLAEVLISTEESALISSSRADNQIVETIINPIIGSNRRRSITETYGLNNPEVLEFRNSIESRHSIEALEQCLIFNTKSVNKMKLFILSQFELESLEIDYRRRLLHLLNLININSKRIDQNKVKFFLLAHQMNQQNFDYWSRMGSIKRENLIRESGSENFKIDFSSSSNKQLQSMNIWINSKLANLIPNESKFDQRRFEDFNQTFICFFEAAQESLLSQMRSLDKGLAQLDDFEKSVQLIKNNCYQEDRQLELQRTEIENLIVTIDASLGKSKKQRKQLDLLGQKQLLKSKELEEKDKTIQKELSIVKTFVEESKSQIKQHLKPESLNEIKSLRSPPKTIKDILDVLFVLLQVEDNSWSSMKSYLTKHSLRDELTNFDIEKLLSKRGPNLILRIEREIEQKGDSFNESQATKASKAVVPMLNWIKATLAYGKALIRLAPLSEELKQLQQQQNQLTAEAMEVEIEVTRVNKNMAHMGDKLKQLELDYEQSRLRSSKVKSQLDRAQQVRLDLEDQVKRWRDNSRSILKILDQNGACLVKMSLVVSWLCFYFKKSINSEDFARVKSIFELQLKEEDFIRYLFQIIGLIRSLKDGFQWEELDIISLGNQGEIYHLVQLAQLDVFFKFSSRRLLLFLDTKGSRLSNEDLTEYLSYKSILFPSTDLVIINNTSNIMNEETVKKSLDLAMKLNKLIVIRASDSMPGSKLLDFLHFIHKRMSNYKRILIVGNLETNLSLTEHVNIFNLLTSYETMAREELSDLVCKHWIELKEAELGSKIESLEIEFKTKKADVKALELNLLKKLATSSINSKTNTSLDEGLVNILSDLQRSSNIVKEDMKKLSQKMSEQQTRKNELMRFAGEAAKFYKSHLAHLSSLNPFYHVPLDHYIRLLANEMDLNSSKEMIFDRSLLEKVVDYVKLPMRPEDKREFQNRISETRTTEAGQSLHLSNVIERMLFIDDDKRSFINNKSFELMIVLHDACKSSPQIELDELLRRHLNVRVYQKLYATSSSSSSNNRIQSSPWEALEMSFIDFLSSQENNHNKLIDSRTKNGNHQFCCLCIANAQLAVDWINTRLIGLLSQGGYNKGNSRQSKSLIILVAEAPDACGGGLFAPEVLDFASVRFWYDELSLSTFQRFKMIEKRSLRLMESSDEKIKSLLRQLILFHVICQLKTKQQIGKSQPKLWNYPNYNFDYDLFWLALQTLLNQIKDGDSMDDIRLNLAHYLESIIYVSRMQTVEDEKLLCELVTKFIRLPLSQQEVESYLAESDAD